MSRTLSLALMCLLAVASRAAFAQAPSQPQSSSGGAYTVQVPVGWKWESAPDDAAYTDVMRIMGAAPVQALILLQAARLRAPLEVLEASVRQSLARQGAAVRNESRTPVGGMPAWRFERAVVEEARRLRMVQVLVDGGQRKVVVTAIGPDPFGPETRQGIDAVIASLTIAPGAPPAAPQLAVRELAGHGLKLALPEGGVLTEQETGLQIVWQELGLLFRAEWRRTTASLKEAVQLDFEGVDPKEEDGVTSEVAESQAVDLSGGPGRSVRVHGVYEGKRIMTIRLLYRASGPGEVVSFGFARFGEVPFEDLAALSQEADRAEVAAHFRAPDGALPPMEGRAQVWRGGASVRLPAGWSTATAVASEPGAGRPGPEERRRWAAAGAADLGLTAECGTIAGGQPAFEDWLRKRLFKRRLSPVASPARPVQVGGKPGFAWDIEYGPAFDRWQATVVAVLENGRYHLLQSQCPQSCREAYGSLAEKAAATIEWRGK